MIRLHEPHPNDVSTTPARRWPFAELERLLNGESAGRGDDGARRVLVAGSDCGELVAWLKGLGWEAVLFDEVIRGHHTGSSNCVAFERVLDVELDATGSNLFDFNSRSRTARLLSQLRPSGQLLVLSPLTGEPGPTPGHAREDHCASEQDFPAGHHAACRVRHLACFPGKLQTMTINSTPSARSVWRWMIGAGVRPGDAARLSWSVVSLRIPAEPVTAIAWLDHVQRGLLTGKVCCESAALAMTQQRRVA